MVADPELAAKRRMKRGLAKRAARQRKVDQYTRDKARPIRRMARLSESVQPGGEDDF